MPDQRAPRTVKELHVEFEPDRPRTLRAFDHLRLRTSVQDPRLSIGLVIDQKIVDAFVVERGTGDAFSIALSSGLTLERTVPVAAGRHTVDILVWAEADAQRPSSSVYLAGADWRRSTFPSDFLTAEEAAESNKANSFLDVTIW